MIRNILAAIANRTPSFGHPWPEGETRTETLQDELEARDELITSLFLYTSYHTETQLTTEQKDLFYDIWDEHNRLEYPDEFRPADRWWRS